MNLLDIVYRQSVPTPWAEGEKIPWHDAAFSARMLKEHLSQEHDSASRRFTKIDLHVEWIHHHLLSAVPTKILDLGCGPGLYASRLARLGHECVGIDFSPASIAYARRLATTEDLACTYQLNDIRTAEYGTGYGLAMFVFGEFNVFRVADARLILQKAHDALVGSGLLLLEPHTYAAVQEIGQQSRLWYATASGLFADGPHLCLAESSWDPEESVATERYYVIDAQTSDVKRYAGSVQAYSDQAYQSLLHECGFGEIAFYPSLVGTMDDSQSDFFVIVARKHDNTKACH